MKGKLRGLFLFLIFFVCSSSSAMAEDVSIRLNGYALPLSTPAIIQNDRVMVPMRNIFEALGYAVSWDENSRSVTAVRDDVTLLLAINDSRAKVNATSVILDAPPLLRNSTTMVPLRFVAEHSGATVNWDADRYTVFITTLQQSQQDPSDAVVYIQTNKVQGGGVVLSADGLIATNFHIIEGAATAQFVFNDGSIYQGDTTVVGLDEQSDIALLRIARNGLIPAVTSTEITIGSAVTAIGSPSGQRNHASTGIISGYNADIIDTTAPIAHGSSGGGLFDSKGRLIGITSAYADKQYFSIPIAKFLETPQDLSIPLNTMREHTYIPTAPKNLQYTYEDGYAYISWSPVLDADYFYVYIANSMNQEFVRLKNQALDAYYWYWAFPQSFGIAVHENRPFYLRVSAVRDGVEYAQSPPIRVSVPEK